MEDAKRIRRRVIEYDRYRVYSRSNRSWCQIEKLECGHEVYNKGSVGRANKRVCRECEQFRDGKIKTDFKKIEIWDPEEERTVFIPYEKEVFDKHEGMRESIGEPKND